MEFDDRRFLTLVAEYPCLYDSHDPNYKNSESRQICWMDIGNELHFEDTEFLKKKWDLSKEKFRRIRKKITRSEQPSLALEWPLYPLMYSYFDPFIKTRNRLCAAEKKELNLSQQSHHQSYQEDQSENSLPVESKLFIGTDPYVHHETSEPATGPGLEVAETSSIASPSPASSSEHQSSDNLVQTPVHTPKSKKFKRISSETSSSTLLCEAMKLWTDAVHQTRLRDHPSSTSYAISNSHTSTDEITLYCLSYAARLKTLPIEAVDDIRIQMENLMRDARLKFSKV